MQTIGPAAASMLSPSAGVAMARHRGLDECDRLFAPRPRALCDEPGHASDTGKSGSRFHGVILLHFRALGSRTAEPVERWIRSGEMTSLRREEPVARAPKWLLLGKCRDRWRSTGSSHGVSTFGRGRHFAVFARFDLIAVMRFI
jgi:hypothetical protein